MEEEQIQMDIKGEKLRMIKLKQIITLQQNWTIMNSGIEGVTKEAKLAIKILIILEQINIIITDKTPIINILITKIQIKQIIIIVGFQPAPIKL